MLSVIYAVRSALGGMQSVTCKPCFYAECHYAECHYAECRVGVNYTCNIL